MFYNNLDIIVSDFQNNDKRKFWKVIRHFVKNNKSASCIPPLCSTLSNGDNQWHFNDQDKANCLNDYFASISTINDAEPSYLPLLSLLITIFLKLSALNSKLKILLKYSTLTKQVVMMA